MKTVYKNIKQLIGAYDSPVGLLEGAAMAAAPMTGNAFLIVKDGVVEKFGGMDSLSDADVDDATVEDLSGQFVFPAFADSHTHIVYAGSREQEYEDKIRGLSYVEIARRGGGILNSADLLRRTSENDLYEMAMERLMRCVEGGTGAIEIKSGYGLSTGSELKMLRVIHRMKETAPVAVRSNFLAAHAFPREFANDHDGYVSLIVGEMLPEVAKEGLADFVDVFCDEGFFTIQQTERILAAAAKYGMRPKIHANELARSGGIQLGVKYGALSVDHLEHTGDEEIAALKGSGTVATVLPGAAFFLGMPYAPARRMVDCGLPVAVASDYNPGSSPSASMKFVLSLASIKMKLSPVEALNAATVNGANAMGLGGSHGQIVPGWKANFIITKPMPSFAYFSYAYTENLIEKVVVNK
ncbi:MAG TPA: imidazolonepropionase [Candidatus Limisoma gallistercoris]|nr:imidazolonepropionase [Candidatus Limisoma gallistercoris]